MIFDCGNQTLNVVHSLKEYILFFETESSVRENNSNVSFDKPYMTVVICACAHFNKIRASRLVYLCL